ncbi:MAG: glycosyltransferase family 2 protein [Elusimicrobia bacterium]|nr:glycosyltransferase family 2 protein [Elusimicrobiota bacterium]
MKLQTLTIAIPAYNEESTLEDAVQTIIATLDKLTIQYEIIVVNDGSQDKTGLVLDSLAKKYPLVKAIHHAHNKMIGAAFLSALHHSQSSHIMLIPVDNPLSSNLFFQFIESAKDADIVVGYRNQRLGYQSWMTILSKIYWLFCIVMFQIKLKDFTWICMYDRLKIKDLSPKSYGIAIFPEILVKAKKRGLKIVEIECPMIARRVGKATISKISRILHLFFETVYLWGHLHFGKWQIK